MATHKIEKRAVQNESELLSDAWSRFERAVDVVAKSPPQHRSKDKKPKRRKRIIKRSESAQT